MFPCLIDGYLAEERQNQDFWALGWRLDFGKEFRV